LIFVAVFGEKKEKNVVCKDKVVDVTNFDITFSKFLLNLAFETNQKIC
jgi:hypothetical protein